jgi:hypothetical protein
MAIKMSEKIAEKNETIGGKNVLKNVRKNVRKMSKKTVEKMAAVALFSFTRDLKLKHFKDSLPA